MVKFIVGITGGSGVGKTTLIKKLYAEFPDKISTISLDNYYKPKEEQHIDENGKINFDLPTALNTEKLKSDIDLLLNNQIITKNKYTFNNPNKEADIIQIFPKEILIIEGLFVMEYDFIREILDYAVYLIVDPEIQLERRLKRDINERNYHPEDIIYQWKNHVVPAYENYVKPYRNQVDLMITNHNDFDENVHVLMDKIHENID